MNLPSLILILLVKSSSAPASTGTAGKALPRTTEKPRLYCLESRHYGGFGPAARGEATPSNNVVPTSYQYHTNIVPISPHRRTTVAPPSYQHRTTIVPRSQGWLRRDGRRKCPKRGRLSGLVAFAASWAVACSLRRSRERAACWRFGWGGAFDSGSKLHALSRKAGLRAIRPFHPPACPAPRYAFSVSISRPPSA
jgi:hypothetical protein